MQDQGSKNQNKTKAAGYETIQLLTSKKTEIIYRKR